MVSYYLQLFFYLQLLFYNLDCCRKMEEGCSEDNKNKNKAVNIKGKSEFVIQLRHF